MKYLILLLLFFAQASSWAEQNLSDSISYRQSRRVVKKLQEKTIVGVKILWARGGDKIYNQFGHVAARLVDKDDKPLNDIVISYVAHIAGSPIDYKKGFLGDYQIVVKARTLERYLSNKIYIQGRRVTAHNLEVSRSALSSYLQQINNFFFNLKNSVNITGFLITVPLFYRTNSFAPGFSLSNNPGFSRWLEKFNIMECTIQCILSTTGASAPLWRLREKS